MAITYEIDKIKLPNGDIVTLAGGSVNDAELTFKKGTTTVKSFTANASTGVTVTFATGTVLSSASLTGSETAIDTTKFSGGSFTQGSDSFTANTPTVIDTTKFSGGSFTRGTFTGGSFTQGTDNFTTNTPTVINTAKFNGGSFTRGTFTANTPTSVTYTVSGTGTLASPGTLVLSVTEGIPATHAADSYTSASFQTGFYTAGTSASFTQGTDSFTAATHANDSFTAAKLNTGFYTAGTSASFTQGSDSYTSAKLNTGFYTAGTLGLSTSTMTVLSNVS